MSMLPVSKPVFAGLLITLIATLITTLMPAPSVIVDPFPDLLVDRPVRAETNHSSANPFRRPDAVTIKSMPLTGFVNTPPPPPPAPPPPPVPVVIEAPIPVGAPTPPFTYAGQLIDGQQTIVFLLLGEDAVAVTPGERVNHQWQFDRMQDDALLFRHLPTQQTQSLRMEP